MDKEEDQLQLIQTMIINITHQYQSNKNNFNIQQKNQSNNQKKGNKQIVNLKEKELNSKN